MVWFGVTGSWRFALPQVEQDVRREVHSVLQAGNGIVTGGALGVDMWATDEALRFGATAQNLIVVLPTPLETYAAYYRKRAGEGVVTGEQVEALISQLETVNSLKLLRHIGLDSVTTETYYARNSEVERLSSALLAFHVNSTAGTQDTIDKARAAGKEVRLYSYTA